MKQRLRRWWINLRLKYKIDLLIILAVFLTAASSIAGSLSIAASNEALLQSSVSNSLTYITDQLGDQLDLVTDEARQIMSNSTVQTELAALPDKDSVAAAALCRDQIYEVLRSYYLNASRDCVQWITIVQEDTVISTRRTEYLALSKDIRGDLIERAAAAKGHTLWVTDYSDSAGILLVKQLRQVDNLTLKNLGTLILCVDPEALASSAGSAIQEQHDSSLILLQNGEPFYYDPDMSREELDRICERADNRDYTILSVDGHSLFLVSCPVKGYGWTTICVLNYDSIRGAVLRSLLNNLVFLTVALVLGLTLTSFVTDRLCGHLDWLITRMDHFSRQIYETPDNGYDYAARKDEIGQLHTHFDDMNHQLRDLIQQNYVLELEKKDAQLRELESRMDPHFLYNVLDSIKWRAKESGSDEIVEMTTALATLLRASLQKGTDSSTLARELELIDSYMTIQRLRYGNRLVYHCCAESGTLQCEMPRFSLQPLVENAIRYGLEASPEECTITVSARLCDRDLIVSVVNTGSEFEEHLLEKLESGEKSPHGFGIGTLNIHKRLRLLYGENYGLRLYNIEDQETYEMLACAEIRLPAQITG